MASNSENIGRRQKRRKVQQNMDNFLLSVEADFSVAGFNNGGGVPGGGEKITALMRIQLKRQCSSMTIPSK